MQTTRSYLYTWPEKNLSLEQQHFFQSLITQRIKGVPIAYLCGVKEFWSLSLTVTNDTLIPRPETELLVEQALAKIARHANWAIADLGTGSGAIALAIASERPHCRIYASDISYQALNIAKQNAQQLDIHNVKFCCGNWLQPYHATKFNMILSNPPYIAQADKHLTQGDVSFEPISALVSGSQGLDDLSIIIHHAKNYLLKNGYLVLEHGYEQHHQLQALFAHHGYVNISTIHDLNGLARVTMGQHATAA